MSKLKEQAVPRLTGDRAAPQFPVTPVEVTQADAHSEQTNLDVRLPCLGRLALQFAKPTVAHPLLCREFRLLSRYSRRGLGVTSLML